MSEEIDNLRHRLEYVSKFVNFTNEDISILNLLGKTSETFVPMIVDKIFQRFLDFDVTKRYFLMRHFGYTGVVPVNESQLNLESEQMIFRRLSFAKYLKRILRQKVWNDAFLEYLSFVGKIHTRFAGAHSVDIDYIHMNVSLGYTQHLLIESVLANQQFDWTTKQSAILALNKLFWIQNDFFAMHYIKLHPQPNNRCAPSPCFSM